MSIKLSDVAVVAAAGVGAAVGATLSRSLSHLGGGLDPLVFDLYEGDHGLVDMTPAARDARFVGGYLKATQGTYFASTPWFPAQWSKMGEAGKLRTLPWEEWGRGAYHYLTSEDGAAQADNFAALYGRVAVASTDYVPWLDIEYESNAHPLSGASKAQIVDAIGAFCDRTIARFGRIVGYLSTSLFAEKGIRKSDVPGLWKILPASYTPSLDRSRYEQLGYDVGDLFGWQYTGVDKNGVALGQLAGYPVGIAGIGNLDITAMQIAPQDARVSPLAGVV